MWRDTQALQAKFNAIPDAANYSFTCSNRDYATFLRWARTFVYVACVRLRPQNCQLESFLNFYLR